MIAFDQMQLNKEIIKIVYEGRMHNCLVHLYMITNIKELPILLLLCGLIIIYAILDPHVNLKLILI